MNTLSSKDRGFTLIELLVVVAIIGILASMIIPNMLDALNKAKQKRSVVDIHETGTAMMAWLTDHAAAAAAGSSATQTDLSEFATISPADLKSALQPLYMQLVPVQDGWKTTYDFYLNTDRPVIPNVMATRSAGRDRQFSSTVYTASPFDATDFDQDIVWTDGFFIRWPTGSR